MRTTFESVYIRDGNFKVYTKLTNHNAVQYYRTKTYINFRLGFSHIYHFGIYFRMKLSCKGTLLAMLSQRRSVVASKAVAARQEGLIQYLVKIVTMWTWYMVQLRSFDIIISFLVTCVGWLKDAYTVAWLLKQNRCPLQIFTLNDSNDVNQILVFM